MLRLLSLVCYAGLSETELGHPTLAFGVMGETGQIKLLSHYFWPQLSLIFGSLAPSKQYFYQNTRVHIEISSSLSRGIDLKEPIWLSFCIYISIFVYICLIYSKYFTQSVCQKSLPQKAFFFRCFLYG